MLTALSLRIRYRLVVQDHRVMTRVGDEAVVSVNEEMLGRVLGLSAIDACAARLLSDLLCKLVGLHKLRIDWAEVTDQDCVEVQRGLKALTGLQRLEFSAMGEVGAKALFEGLRDAPLKQGVCLTNAV
jgi:hypothetical protein